MRFPSRRDDGTFSVDVVLRTNSNEQSVSEWLSRWVAANQEWERTWYGPQSKVVEREILLLSSAFSCVPYVRWHRDGVFAVRFEATKEAVYWKDWMAKLFQDARDELDSVVLVSVTDATSESDDSIA